MRFTILITLFTILSQYSVGQELLDNESPEKWEKLGDNVFNSGDLEMTIEHYKNAQQGFLKDKKYSDYIRLTNYLSYVYHELYMKEEFEKSTLLAYHDGQKYLKADDPEYISALGQLNTYYYNKSDYLQAIKIVHELIEKKITANGETPDLGVDYMNVGNNYQHLGDRNNAINYLNKAKTLIDQLEHSFDEKLRVRESIGFAFREQNKLKEALRHFEGCKYLLDSITNPYNIHSHYLNTGEIYVLKNKFDKAKKEFGKASALNIKNATANIHLLDAQGLMFFKMKNYQKCIQFLNKASSESILHNRRNSNTISAKRTLLLAKSHFKLKDINSSLDLIQTSIESFSKNEDLVDIYSNPKEEDIYNKVEGFELLAYKAFLLHTLYEKDQQIIDLKGTNKTALLAIKVYNSIRKDLLSSQSKLDLSSTSEELFDLAFSSTYQLYKINDDEELASLLFYISEQSRANLLLENYNDKLVRNIDVIPDSILYKERSVIQKINRIKTDLNEKNINESAYEKLNIELSDLYIEFDQLSSFIEKLKPKYHDILYKNQPVELGVLQKLLGENDESILEFFKSKEYYYGFLIEHDKAEIKQFNASTQIDSLLNQFQKALYNKPSGVNPQEDFDLFYMSANTLYNLLLKPILENATTAKLRIIPDGFLHFVPLELFVKSKNSTGYGLENLNYIFEDYSISYDYSSTLLYKSAKLKNDHKNQKNFLGIAPIFNNNAISCNGVTLRSLSCNGEELQKIKNKFPHGIEIKEDLDISNLQQSLHDYGILHFATHSCIDTSLNSNHKIILNDKSISSLNIESLELSNDLTVLSACSTGDGILREGEGVFSLARNFIDAGSKSVVLSLWPIDDCSTSKVMEYFYDQLSVGLQKDQSLKKAKVQYLENASKTKMHPYYWGAFLTYGSIDQISIQHKNESNSFLTYLLVGCLFLFIAIYIYRSK